MKIAITKTMIGRVLLLGIVATLSLGSSPVNGQSAKFVASSNLKPQTSAQSAPPAVVIEEVREVPVSTPKDVSASPVASGGGNGYVMAGNNCVACVKAMTGRGQNGNAGTWKASSSTPSIGAIMIWRSGQMGASSAGHVGVVVGINSDGTVNIAHCNWPGQTRFKSTGNFW